MSASSPLPARTRPSNHMAVRAALRIVAECGLDRAALWRALPEDGSWVDRNTWQTRLGLGHMGRSSFGHAIKAADVADARKRDGVMFYRRRQR